MQSQERPDATPWAGVAKATRSTLKAGADNAVHVVPPVSVNKIVDVAPPCITAQPVNGFRLNVDTILAAAVGEGSDGTEGCEAAYGFSTGAGATKVS